MGLGNGQYRSGPPVYLDVWNFSSPTIMVTEIVVRVNDAPNKEELLINEPLRPQLLVESSKVAAINVAYNLNPA